jgi:hypothetical protein
MSLREKLNATNEADKREKVMGEITTDYAQYGQYRMKQIETKNIMIIGRTRSGK